MKRNLEILIASIVVVIVFGIIHNQITIRISPYFFTDVLPQHPWVNGDNLTLLAFAWGVTSTWWVGLIGGFLLTFFARIGNEPRIIVSDLVNPTLVAIIIAILIEIILGYIWASFYEVYFYREINLLPSEKDSLYLVSGLHDSSYIAGGIAFVGLAIWVIIVRFRMRRREKKKRLVDPWD